MRSERTIWIAVLVLLLAACGGGDFTRNTGEAHAGEEHAGHEEGFVALSAEKLQQVEIATAEVTERRLSAALETTGEVGYEEDRIAHVAPRVSGRVQRVPARLGDEVRRGDLLAVLDSVELGQAKAEYLAARTRAELAEQNYERERRLHADRITSERDMLEARAAHLEAASMRDAARETLRLYGLSLDRLDDLASGDPRASLLEVRSPLAGRVVEKHATLGELATPQESLFTIADLGDVWIWIDVYERDLAQVHRGDDVEVVVEPFPGRTFSGEVSYLSPEVSAETRSIRARIDVENAERLLRPGMFASVRLVDPHTQDAAPTLVVPEAAVVRRGEETLVFSPAGEGEGGDGRRFAVREVRLGRQEGSWLEVLSGLAAGDEVVVAGTFFLESELAREQLGGGHRH